MKWYIYIKGRYIGTVESTLAEIKVHLKRPHKVFIAGHSIEIF